MSIPSNIEHGIVHEDEADRYAVILAGETVGTFLTYLQALRALERGTGHTLGEPSLTATREENGTTGQRGPTGARKAEPAQRLTPYQQTVARLRAECTECADDTSRPEHVSLRSWHEWGHCYDGAPTESRCTCGVELRNTPMFWHCGGCHATFHGEDAFMRHRRGPGGARYCLEPQNSGRARDWWDAQGVWHYGHRRGSSGAPVTTPPSVEPIAA